ncbi:hypothetical protein SUGI_0125680 [Cryptomeria japonica]|nr:hypothetical protein SUGI_0125680 [Cryptomeria japonica]
MSEWKRYRKRDVQKLFFIKQLLHAPRILSAESALCGRKRAEAIRFDCSGEQRPTAQVESGATLGQLYSAIANKTSLYGFPAGVCPTVGVGGTLSGGGLGLLARKYGVSADHVMDGLLADANGKLVDRKGIGEDVFWALRGGGGGSWGVVVAWQIRLVKVPPVISV